MFLTSVTELYCSIFLLLTFYIMIQYFKDSVRELKHVVWPTREETRNFFIVVMVILIAFWLYLFAASTVFSEIMFFLRDLINA